MYCMYGEEVPLDQYGNKKGPSGNGLRAHDATTEIKLSDQA